MLLLKDLKKNLPYISMGSHCDSVVQGGNYDGILGILTAMEVAETIITEKNSTSSSNYSYDLD